MSSPVALRSITFLEAKGRKRRSKVGKKRKSSDADIDASATDSSSSSINIQAATGEDDSINRSKRSRSETSTAIPDFDEKLLEKSLKDSKLPPLSGTGAAAKAKYEEKGAIERYIDELTAPTPAGQEPKAVKLVKNITWVSVLVLVLVEIFVSIKVGGAPFDLNKVSFGGAEATPP